MTSDLYCYIEDDKIASGAQGLPTNWRDKGDLNLVSEQEWRAEGWVPVVVVPNRREGEIALDPAYVLAGDHVVMTLSSKPVSAEQIEAAKAQAWEGIKAERDRRQSDGGVQVGDKWFMSNDKEAGRYNLIITAARAAGVPGTYVMRAAWRTMQDGVTQDMTANLAGQIILTGLALFAAIDDAALAHKAAMEASADPLAYDFSGGWPKVFGE